MAATTAPALSAVRTRVLSGSAPFSLLYYLRSICHSIDVRSFRGGVLAFVFPDVLARSHTYSNDIAYDTPVPVDIVYYPSHRLARSAIAYFRHTMFATHIYEEESFISNFRVPVSLRRRWCTALVVC